MPTIYSLRSSGVPTSTAVSANLNLSGLDDFAQALDTPAVMDTEWYDSRDDSQDEYRHPELHAPLSLSAVEPFANNIAFSYARHNPQVDDDAFVELDPMNAHAFPSYSHDHHRALTSPISPLQPQYNPNAYQTPYPDSTASSAPSEDPVFADAEEDKRKRNQAASARFRQKKKQREQQMMEQTRGMQEKNKRLEGEVESLKRENLFLKKLLVEKIDNMSEEEKGVLIKATNGALKT